MNTAPNTAPGPTGVAMLNLVPYDRIERRRSRRRIAAWSGVAAAYALLIVAAALVVHGPAARSLQEVRRDARQATSEAELAAAKREETMKKLASKMRVLEASRTVGQHPDWSLLLSALSRLRGDAIVLTTLELTEAEPQVTRAVSRATPGAGAASAQAAQHGPQRHDDFRLRLVGLGLAHSDVMAFVAKLEDLGPLKDVTVVDARSGRVGEGELTNFELTCRITDQAETGGVK